MDHDNTLIIIITIIRRSFNMLFFNHLTTDFISFDSYFLDLLYTRYLYLVIYIIDNSCLEIEYLSIVREVYI